MSLWTKLAALSASALLSVKSWVAPEVDAAKAALDELGHEIEKNGPQLVYDVCVAALETVGTPGLPTGKLITAAADVAIEKLKAEGKADITAMVFGSISAALLKLHASAAQAGTQTAEAPAPAP